MRYDPETDALVPRFAAPVVGSEGGEPGLIRDFDADGRPAALEILDASAPLAAGVDIRTLGSEAA